MEHGFNRQWARDLESALQQHGWQGRRGSGWGGWQWGPPGRPSGPPPWLAGLFGLVGQETPQPRGPRVRRGDVRMAILAVLADGSFNGYQVIQEIAERTSGAWRPSPGSVYPTISQLEDEGLVEGDDEPGRRTLRLSDAGRAYLAEHEREVAQVWAPFSSEARHARSRDTDEDEADWSSLKPELGRVMNAVWQILTTGTDEQRRAAIGVLMEARRGLYQILADHPADEVDDLGDRGGPDDNGYDEEEL
jgi:DNA-binding PadR family transcriptional regulator